MKEESRFAKNFSSLNTKVMQMQSGKVKKQKGRNGKLRATYESLVGRTDGESMQFVLDMTLNSSGYHAG